MRRNSRRTTTLVSAGNSASALSYKWKTARAPLIPSGMRDERFFFAMARARACVYTRPSALFLSNDRFAIHRDPLRIPCESSLRVPTKKKLRASTEKSSQRHRRRRGLDRVRAMSRLTTTSKKMASSVADHDIYLARVTLGRRRSKSELKERSAYAGKQRNGECDERNIRERRPDRRVNGISKEWQFPFLGSR